jgi:tRNA (guanosine-2'-O-)-methyltransferase
MPTPARLQKVQSVVSNRQAGLLLVLEDIHDPHNAEAILRTADAFGLQEVWFIFAREKPYDPRRVGRLAAASAAKWIDLRVFGSTAECLRDLREKQFKAIAATLTAPSVFETDLALPKRLALLVGNEHRGLSSTALAQADGKVSIPMRGMVESLNVSVTAAILLYEITRARLAGGRLSNLSHAEQQRLIKNFLAR